MPGRHVTDRQMRLFMQFRKSDPATVAAAKAGFQPGDRLSAGKGPTTSLAKEATTLPPPTRSAGGVWDKEVLPMLKAAPGLRPIGVFEELRRRHPDLAPACAARWSDAFGTGAPSMGPSRR